LICLIDLHQGEKLEIANNLALTIERETFKKIKGEKNGEP